MGEERWREGGGRGKGQDLGKRGNDDAPPSDHAGPLAGDSLCLGPLKRNGHRCQKAASFLCPSLSIGSPLQGYQLLVRRGGRRMLRCRGKCTTAA